MLTQEELDQLDNAYNQTLQTLGFDLSDRLAEIASRRQHLDTLVAEVAAIKHQITITRIMRQLHISIDGKIPEICQGL